MEPLKLEASHDTPKVFLDVESGHFEFVGNSYPENSTKVYNPVLEWLNTWAAEAPNETITVDFNFDYFNTSSAKYILEVLRVFRDYEGKGHEVIIRWYYFEDDTDMLEAGEDYMDTLDMDFELVEKEDDEFDF